MIAVDLSNDIIGPLVVGFVGAVVAGSAALVQSWIENRGARSRGNRKLDLARQRTDFAKDWIEISNSFEASAGDLERVPGSERPAADLRAQAKTSLDEAVKEAERAFYEASADTSTALQQLRSLLMMVRRRNPASYALSGLFLFLSLFAWLIVCIPSPRDDDFSIPWAIAVSIALTLVLRLLAGLVVRVLEDWATDDAETITMVEVSNNTATITTKGPHGLSGTTSVVIDASIDRFDGTFDVARTSDNEFSFRPRQYAADVESLGMQGWVCGIPVKKQIQQLFMLDGARLRRPMVVSGLFLISVGAFSAWAVADARSEIGDGQYSICYGQPYDGGYFGYFDDGGFDPTSADSAAEFLNTEAPVWGPAGALPIGAVATAEDDSTLVAADGSEFTLDEGRLLYAEGETVLHRRTADLRLEQIGDPCDPQQVNVRIAEEATDPELFNYFDDRAGFETGEDPLYLYPAAQDAANTPIQAYFGSDGRLIPVCDAVRYPEVQPCLDRGSAYYDPGLEATVNRTFQAGLWIFGFAILARLLFGLIADRIEGDDPPGGARNNTPENTDENAGENADENAGENADRVDAPHGLPRSE